MSLQSDVEFFLDETELRLRELAEKTKHKMVSGRHAGPMVECTRCELEKRADRAGELSLRLRREDP